MSNKEIVLKFYEDVWNAHDASKVPDYVHEGYIQHNPAVAQGRAGLLEFLKFFFTREAKHDIVLALEDGDLVAVLVNVSFNDGSKALVTDIYRLEDGKMAEHWDCLQK